MENKCPNGYFSWSSFSPFLKTLISRIRCDCSDIIKLGTASSTKKEGDIYMVSSTRHNFHASANITSANMYASRGSSFFDESWDRSDHSLDRTISLNGSTPPRARSHQRSSRSSRLRHHKKRFALN